MLTASDKEALDKIAALWMEVIIKDISKPIKP